jgi:hypothetical protein
MLFSKSLKTTAIRRLNILIFQLLFLVFLNLMVLTHYLFSSYAPVSFITMGRHCNVYILVGYFVNICIICINNI